MEEVRGPTDLSSASGRRPCAPVGGAGLVAQPQADTSSGLAGAARVCVCVSGALITSNPRGSVTAVGWEWQGTQSSSVASRDQVRRGPWDPGPSRSWAGVTGVADSLHLTMTGGRGLEVT